MAKLLRHPNRKAGQTDRPSLPAARQISTLPPFLIEVFVNLPGAPMRVRVIAKNNFQLGVFPLLQQTPHSPIPGLSHASQCSLCGPLKTNVQRTFGRRWARAGARSSPPCSFNSLITPKTQADFHHLKLITNLSIAISKDYFRIEQTEAVLAG
jgi:hypothetical protein